MHLAKPGEIIFKILWAPFLLVAFIASIYVVGKAISQYNSFSFSTMTVITREESLNMPSITICSEGNIQDMLLYCVLGSTTKLCIQDNLTRFVEFYNVIESFAIEMNCVRLNFGSINNDKITLQQSFGDGWMYGFEMIMYLNRNAYFGITDNSELIVDSEINNDLSPDSMMNDISLTKISQKRLGKPYSKCKDSEQSEMKNSMHQYRQVNCIQDCYYQIMNKKCGCPLFPQSCPLLNSSDECKSAYNNRTIIQSECKKECPLECNKVIFQKTRLNTKWHTSHDEIDQYKENYLSTRFNISGLTDDDIAKKLAYAYFYFDVIETTEIIQIPSMTPLDLVATVGGILGNNLSVVSSIFQIINSKPILLF